MDITLADLQILEPRLRQCNVEPKEPAGDSDAANAEVSWAVTARMTAPHLPTLRGSEVILVPSRVAAELGSALPALLREAARRQASAIVLTQEDIARVRNADLGQCMLLCWTGSLAVDTENLINRALTECRGNLYRIGSELERQVADLHAGKFGIESVVQMAAAVCGMPIAVLDGKERFIARAGSDGNHERSFSLRDEGELRRQIASGDILVLGPLHGEQRIIARFLLKRIEHLVAAALRRDDATRPRGSRKVEATEALLTGKLTDPKDQRTAAVALGIEPDATFLVALAKADDWHALGRFLAPLGQVHPAGSVGDMHTALVVVNGATAVANLVSRVQDVKRRWERELGSSGGALALSAPIEGVSSLPGAYREAAFIAALQTNAGMRRAASFDSIDDMGVLRLLYPLRESHELQQFVTRVLGTLQERDQRGTLRATLRAYLESGGSQVDAAQRLGIHRNTLAYRLNRIGEIIGRDVADPRAWQALHLALSASEVLAAGSDDA